MQESTFPNIRILHSIDGDTILEPDFFLKIMKPIIESTEQEVLAAGGNVLIANGSSIVQGQMKGMRLSPGILGLSCKRSNTCVHSLWGEWAQPKQSPAYHFRCIWGVQNSYSCTRQAAMNFRQDRRGYGACRPTSQNEHRE